MTPDTRSLISRGDNQRSRPSQNALLIAKPRWAQFCKCGRRVVYAREELMNWSECQRSRSASAVCPQNSGKPSAHNRHGTGSRSV
jgi:hypothetical protein